MRWRNGGFTDTGLGRERGEVAQLAVEDAIDEETRLGPTSIDLLNETAP